MTDMQISLPLLIVRPSILNPSSTSLLNLRPVKWNALGYTFALRISISSPFLSPSSNYRCNQCTNTIMNDMIHSISSYDLFGQSILTLLALHRCLGPSVPSLAQASLPRGTLLQSLDLPFTIATGPSSLFSTLFTWLHFMSHMQWVPSSHYMSIASTLSHFSSMAHVAHTSVFVWTNHLCIST